MRLIIIIFAFLLINTINLNAQNFGYLNWIELNKQFSSCFDGTDITQCDEASWELSFIGLNKQSIETYNIKNKNFFVSASDSTTRIEDYTLVNAKNYIITRAIHEKVIMINEAHHQASNRVFTGDLLKPLYDQGFRYLGVEGLSENSIALMSRKYPTINSGYYIKEPQYGNLIREAIQIGFTVFNYDTGGRGAEREENQALNIAEIIKKDSSAHIIIHAGWGHIREDNEIFEGLMAYRFNKITGINPFTINQCRMMEQSQIDLENPLFKKINDIKNPAVLINKYSRKPYTDSLTDIIVFHPRTEYKDQRPSYLFRNRRYKKVKIKIPANSTFPLIAICYLNNEAQTNKPVPIDVISLNSFTKKGVLYLPFKGKYDIYLLDSGKNVLTHKTCLIKNQQ